MTSEKSHFMRQRRYRPWRYLSGAHAHAASASAPQSPPLRRPAHQRPAGFAVGLDVLEDKPSREAAEPAHQEHGAPGMCGSLIPERWCTGAPLDPVVYAGRVVDVADSGEVTARVWELPGGGESIALLSPEELDHREALPGAVLRIWTWLELPRESSPGADTEPIFRMHLEVDNPALSDEDCAVIEDLLRGEDS